MASWPAGNSLTPRETLARARLIRNLRIFGLRNPPEVCTLCLGGIRELIISRTTTLRVSSRAKKLNPFRPELANLKFFEKSLENILIQHF